MIPQGRIARSRGVTERSTTQRDVRSTARAPVSQKQHLTFASQDLRRLSQRKNFVPAPQAADNEVSFIFPRERLGVNYDLNWQLNRVHKVVPTNEGFRNLHMRHLLMYTQGKADKSKAIEVNTTGAEDFQIYYTNPLINPRFANAGTAKTLDGTVFRKIGRLVADTIGSSEQIFVEDAAIGAHRLAEVKVRTITNSANVNLYLRHALSRSPIGDIRKFGEDLVAYIAPGLQLDNAVGGNLGVTSKAFAVLNLDRKTLVMAGTNSTTAVRSALTAFAANRLLLDDFPSLILNAHLVTDASGKTAFVIDPSRSLVSPSTSKSVNGYDGVAWNHYGAFRLFDSITHAETASPRTRGDLVEKTGKTVQITQPLGVRPLEVAHPSAIVVVTAGAGPEVGVFKNPDAAVKFLAAGDATSKPFFQNFDLLQPGQYTKFLTDLLATHKVPVYVVNSKKGGKELSKAELNTLVGQAISGKLSAASL